MCVLSCVYETIWDAASAIYYLLLIFFSLLVYLLDITNLCIIEPIRTLAVLVISRGLGGNTGLVYFWWGPGGGGGGAAAILKQLQHELKIDCNEKMANSCFPNN